MILEMRNHIMLDDLTPYLTLLVRRLKEEGATITTSAQVSEILPDGAMYVSHGQKLSTGGMEAVVLGMGTVSKNSLQEELEDLNI